MRPGLTSARDINRHTASCQASHGAQAGVSVAGLVRSLGLVSVEVGSGGFHHSIQFIKIHKNPPPHAVPVQSAVVEPASDRLGMTTDIRGSLLQRRPPPDTRWCHRRLSHDRPPPTPPARQSFGAADEQHCSGRHPHQTSRTHWHPSGMPTNVSITPPNTPKIDHARRWPTQPTV